MPEIILIATGSEVELARQAYQLLAEQQVSIRLVSMPATTVFDKQSAAYRELVLPKSVTKRVAIEAAIGDFWYKYVGLTGKIIAMESFGESAPDKALYTEFGFTVENIVSTVNDLLNT